MTGDAPPRGAPQAGGHHEGDIIPLLGETAFLYYTSRGRLLLLARPVFARDRETGGWAVLLREGGRETLRLPLPPEAAPALSQPGSKVAAIVRGSRGGWRLLLAGGADEEEAGAALREALAQQLPRDLGLRRAFLLSLRLRRLGPDAFRPLSRRHPHTGP